MEADRSAREKANHSFMRYLANDRLQFTSEC